MLTVEIADLPDRISDYQALENAYPGEIQQAFARLQEGLSVLIRCDKQIVPYLQAVLRKKLQTDGFEVSILDGRTRGDEPPASRIQTVVNQLRELLHQHDQRKLYFLPYLDIVTTSRGGLTAEAREIMTLIHENPLLTLVTFEDPEFPLPELIAQAFPVRLEMLGIERARLPRLITRAEARKFAVTQLNLMGLYKYVSGLNPIRLRNILQSFGRKADCDPADPGQLEDYYQQLRQLTLRSGAGLSRIRLEADIAGYAGVKRQLRENILDLLARANQSADEAAIRSLESLVPRGLIFHGPPGTGKTLFARAMAEALDATVHLVSGPELKSKWVGEGEGNIRRLFAQARASAPAVIVFDELDSLAAARQHSDDSASGAAHSMVNQLLTEMDGFRKEELVFVVGTTNFAESLDNAFLRPGRFEYQILVDYPDYEDRLAILTLYNQRLDTGLSDEQLKTLANWSGRPTPQGTRHSGDHLNALIRDLRRYQLRESLTGMDGEAFAAWLRSRQVQHALTEAEERIVAVHESGHTLALYCYGQQDEIERVTLESGLSDALGLVEFKDRGEEKLYTRAKLRARIAVALGGYAAEELLLGETSSGASADLAKATQLAEYMVAQLGIGNLQIPRTYCDAEGAVNPYFYSLVSPQIDALLLEMLGELREHFKARREQLEALIAELLSKRTLEPAELEALLCPS
ncbi:MAG TPA: AAA family ATPase [Candidatus Obscuribacterales bacterium]